MTVTTTGTNSEGTEAPNEGDATGGDDTEKSKSTKKTELERNFDSLAVKFRQSEKERKDLATKLDAILARFDSQDEGDDDDDDDDVSDEGSQTKDDGKKTATTDGKKNPEVRKLLKKLERERKDYGQKLEDAKNQATAWQRRFEQTEAKRVLNEELAKHKVLPQARPHIIKLVESDIEVQIDDDGTVDVQHKDYPSVGKFLEEFLNENSIFLENTKAGGAGDGGGAERTTYGGGSGGEIKFPNGFANWSPQQKAEWQRNLSPELKKKLRQTATLGGGRR
mgnify:CR=1 FL=1